jgi:hypothetical protein
LPLTPGSRLGPYEILSPLGAGDKGEEHSARRDNRKSQSDNPSAPALRIQLILSALIAAILSVGCTSVAQVSNLTDGPCGASFESHLSSVLTEQGEKPDVADSLAHHTYMLLTTAQIGPRPFLVASPSGTDYSFFVQRKTDRCLLRLYGRQKGFTSYTNDITYIATRDLPGCACQE